MNDTAQLLSDTVNDFLAIRTRQIPWSAGALPGKWSNKEIIGHLIDSAQINLQRFIRCTYEENFKLTYEQDIWVTVQHYKDMELNELLDLWSLLNKQIIRVLKNYPANRIGARCDTNKQEPGLQTVEWLANDYVDHLKHHLNQINNS